MLRVIKRTNNPIDCISATAFFKAVSPMRDMANQANISLLDHNPNIERENLQMFLQSIDVGISFISHNDIK